MTKDEVKAFKDLMEESWNKGMEGDDESIDKFYGSKFVVSFKDNVTGKTADINLDIFPEVWNLFEVLAKDVEEIIEDYEE